MFHEQVGIFNEKFVAKAFFPVGEFHSRMGYKFFYLVGKPYFQSQDMGANMFKNIDYSWGDLLGIN
jgi:hypothetical protein